MDATTALFVDDKGALVEADVDLDPFEINPTRRTALQPSADSEGIAIERDGTVLVSTEAHAHKGSELSILEVDPITGSVLGAPFAPPQDALDRVLDNKGFEALTLASGRALASTTRFTSRRPQSTRLNGDDETHHDVYAWSLDEGRLTNPPLPSSNNELHLPVA